ncbi:MAG: hypothetical protein WCS43_17600, partial [Verrucomicrobiota bacterium]
KETVEHARSVPEGPARLNDVLLQVLDKVRGLPPVTSKNPNVKEEDASHVIAWMLAGLKNWEQGMANEAKVCFSAVASAKISADDSWLGIYQNLARDYLSDGELLSGAVFDKLPDNVAECEAAVATLEKVIGSLKTQGRAKYNVRAWQLDLAKHAKLLSSAKDAPATVVNSMPQTAEIMAKLAEFAAGCRFEDAVAFIKSLPHDPAGAKRAALLKLVESAKVFLSDLEGDLKKQPVSGDFLLKSGEIAHRISIDPEGTILLPGADGKDLPVEWGDFSSDALIGLHRSFVANPKSDSERVRRHECAISYDWLAGNRNRALSAASILSQSSPEFKQHWDAISNGLPK